MMSKLSKQLEKRHEKARKKMKITGTRRGKIKKFIEVDKNIDDLIEI